jgi:hypothetical protein
MVDISAPFETGFALLRDAEMSRIPEERSISKGTAHFKGCQNYPAPLYKLSIECSLKVG